MKFKIKTLLLFFFCSIIRGGQSPNSNITNVTLGAMGISIIKPTHEIRSNNTCSNSIWDNVFHFLFEQYLEHVGSIKL